VKPLEHTRKLGELAAAVGFDWETPSHALSKVHEELKELEEALGGEDQAHIAEELGDVFFTLIQVARLANLDAEQVISQANQKFIGRYQCMQDLAKTSDLSRFSLSEQEQLWCRAKAFMIKS